MIEVKGMTPSEDPPSKAVDIYRDTWVRFLGKDFIVRYFLLTLKLCLPILHSIDPEYSLPISITG